MPGRRTTGRATTVQAAGPPPAFKDCHEAVQAAALEAAGGDMHRIEVVDLRTVRVVNPR